MRRALALAHTAACLALLAGGAAAQVESEILLVNRGMLWQSLSFGKVGPKFNNWARVGVGLDWPGFDASWISEDIGGPPSHLASGGFYIGAKKSRDSILNVEDWSIIASTVSSDAGAKYRVTVHRAVFPSGANHWLRADPFVGEEVLETRWEYNLTYPNLDDRERQLPLRVSRTTHQWSGSRREENYIIHEYVFRNISPELRAAGRAVADTLYGTYLLLNYAMHSNSRAWGVLFPQLPPGARSTWLFYDPRRLMIYGRAGDYRETVVNDEFFPSESLGPVVGGKPTGEFLAPAFVGVRLLYASRNRDGRETWVNKYGWSAANVIDLSGPFAGIGTNESKYAVLENPALAANFVASPADTVYVRRSRLWSMMSLGPWDLLPGDSVVVALAEMVDGLDYRFAVDTAATATMFAQQGGAIFNATADRAAATYAQRRAGRGLNHPDPPPAPKFTVDFYRDKPRFVANVVEWGAEAEGVPDPDDGADDLAGYRVYRSGFLPIGPWDTVAAVPRRDPRFFSAATGRYRLVDSAVQIGANYYYAVTAYDAGRSSWVVDPGAFPGGVPPLETSVFANRLVRPFKATMPAFATVGDVLVVPNPFVIREGFSQPGTGDEIQFVNLPNPCTIRIYTVRGDLVATIAVPEGAGAIASWDQVTDFGQYVESGVYVFHVDSPSGTRIGKFAVIR